MKRRTPTPTSSLSTDSSSFLEQDVLTDFRGGSTRLTNGNRSHRRHHHDRSTKARIYRFMNHAKEQTVQKVQVPIRALFSNENDVATVFRGERPQPQSEGIIDKPPNDRWNYALLILLYTLQGIPMGLSASIPFLLQEKITKLATATASASTTAISDAAVSAAASAATKATYNANAIFALCSWPFSLKLLWAPIVDAVFFKSVGRRKSWLVPVQTLAGCIMVGGANFVERQLGLSSDVLSNTAATSTMNVQGVTTFFFVLYFLMATQDIAVDGWALTMLSKENRGKGPICNSIGQNIGHFLSFVGFLALNDVEASETLWRPLLRLPSNPQEGLIRLRGFLRFMGFLMLGTTLIVALFKRELPPVSTATSDKKQGFLPATMRQEEEDDDDDAELDASTIGLRETYHRLWAVCQLPAVRMLFLVLVTYRLPVALSDNVKFLKAVEYGLSKSTTALLSPTLILPLGILVPIVAHKIWHMAPLQQFATAYQFRVTLVPILDILMLTLLKSGFPHSSIWFWLAVMASTAGQAICNSLQFNAQMIFFASRVDPAIGGSYMTLLNTAANLGGTWPASIVMWLLSAMTTNESSSNSRISSDPYTFLQIVFSIMGLGWLVYFGPKLKQLASLPADAWRTHLLDDDEEEKHRSFILPFSKDVESGDVSVRAWQTSQGRSSGKRE